MRFFILLLFPLLIQNVRAGTPDCSRYITEKDSQFVDQFLGWIKKGEQNKVIAASSDKVKARLTPSSTILQNTLRELDSFERTPIDCRVMKGYTVSGKKLHYVNLSYQWSSPDKWYLGTLALQHNDDTTTVKDFSISSLKEPLEKVHGFNSSRKSFRHWLFLALAISSTMLILIALFICIQTKMARRKWLWILFIICGVLKFTLNWTTGEISFIFTTIGNTQNIDLMTIQLLGSGYIKWSDYHPWLFMTSFPLGAILFLFKRKHLALPGTLKSSPVNSEAFHGAWVGCIFMAVLIMAFRSHGISLLNKMDKTFPKIGIKSKIIEHKRTGCDEKGILEDCFYVAWENYKAKKNPQESKKLFEKSCEGGLMKACSYLGNLEERDGNIARAIKLNEKACEKHDFLGCHSLIFLKNDKKNTDFMTKRSIFFEACKKEKEWGCNTLALLNNYRAINMAEAEAILLNFCHDGFLTGCYRLAELRHEKRELDGARKMYALACNGGMAKACNYWGRLEDRYGDVFKSVKLYKKSCNNGFMMGCGNMANQEKDMKNIDKARVLTRKVCDNNIFMGCYNLGVMEGKEGETAVARKLYQKACNNNIPIACKNLGNIEWDIGNKTKARELYHRACNEEFSWGCINLGIAADQEGDIATAKIFYQKSCSRGFPKACNALGALGYKKKDYASKSYPLYLKACRQGDMNGCTNLGTLESKKGNIAVARKLFKMACKDELSACDYLGVSLFEEGNILEANRLFKKACNGGYMNGCANLGYIRYKQKNFEEARELYTKACNGKNMNGCIKLGVLVHEKGNMVEAKRLYKKACDNDNLSGCHAYGRLVFMDGNVAESKRLLLKACRGEIQPACKDYESMWGRVPSSKQ